MIDLEITLRRLSSAPAWMVEVRSTEDPTFLEVPPLTDRDLAGVPDLAPAARTWKGFLTSLSPGSPLQPGPAALRAVGGILMTKILGGARARDHLAAVERRAREKKRKVRLLIDVEDDDPALDPILACLPVELAHDGTRFFFKQRDRPAFRIAPQSEARNLSLGRGSRVLVATAHADERAPDRDTLQAHAQAVTEAVREAGFEATHLPDATSETLREAILSAPSAVDILYMVCHGIEDPEYAGRLVLRGGSLEGLELARWLEEAVRLDRPVQVVALCACSSASPAADAGTLGMAQWLVRPGRALASLGFRGPVGVDWALRWSERLFRCLGQGEPLEDAFAEAQNSEKDSEPQWVLPVLYARRRDLEPAEEKTRGWWRETLLSFSMVRRTLDEFWRAIAWAADILPDILASLLGPLVLRETIPRSYRRQRRLPSSETVSPPPSLPFTPPPLPRQPRPYFTGRSGDLAQLHTWARQPGAAQITSVAGGGGIGKTEVATKLAHDLRAQRRLVIWLERADKDVRGALATLIELQDPNFKATPETTVEDLAARMRRDLGRFPGLMVLDDISSSDAVDTFRPGESWNVLVTTRTRGLVPGALEIGLGPLGVEDAVRLLSRVAWDRDEPPPDQRAGAERLVERLGYLPLALEMAGRTLRNLVTPEEYLASLDLGEGVAASDRERVHAVLLRSLNDVDPADERVFLALGIWPAPGATGEWMSWVLKEPEPVVTRRLDRLVRANLARWSPETGRYRLHPLLRDAARERARGREEVWNEVHGGVAEAFEKLGAWIDEPLGRKVELTWQRWRMVRDIIDGAEPEPWLQGAPGGAQVADIIAYVLQFRLDRITTELEIYLDQAVKLSQSDNSGRRARVLKVRGDLRHYRDDLEGAARDYGDALTLFQAVEDRLGQANVLQSRGDLLRRRSDLEGAARDYDDALALFRAIETRLGQANVLQARGNLRRRRSDLEGAARDYDDALALFRAIESRLGQANVLQARGILRYQRSDLEGAARDYNDALALFHSVDYRLGQAIVLQARGDLRRQGDDQEGAARDYDEALALFQAVESRLGQANVLHVRGDLRRERSDLEGAARDYEEALALFQVVEDRLGQANVLQARGDLERKRGSWAQALRWYEEALTLYHEVQSPLGLGNTLSEIARAQRELGQPEIARKAAEEALRFAIPGENRYATELARSVLEQLGAAAGAVPAPGGSGEPTNSGTNL